MIPRYSTPEMTDLWSDRARFRAWLRIEVLAAEKMAELGVVPAEDLAELKAKTADPDAVIDVARIDELERTLKHDVIAFLTCVSEHVGPA
ncbi:MAG: adenylosuccinate lyase, partial [Myxococcales bacterium]|nr:adenylosuccinate lyase [Myxococcales bacterium]